MRGHTTKALETPPQPFNDTTDQQFRPAPLCEPLLDAKEAARILRIHPKTVKEMAAAKRIPGLKIGSVWRFRASALDAWVTAQLNSSSPLIAAYTTKEGR